MRTKALLLFLLISYNAYPQLREVSFTEKVTEASLIVEGEIFSKTSFYADNTIDVFTVFEINVFKIFKGELTNISNENRAYIIVPGGSMGTESLHVSPNLDIGINEVGTFFLKSNTVPATTIGYPPEIMYEPTQSAQSKYGYNCETGAVNGVFQNFNTAAIFYENLLNASGQNTIIVQAFTVCDPPVPAPFPIVISGFSPSSVPAGAKEVLTINGSGFGATQGGSKIWFRDNNNPNAIATRSALPIISWNDTQIQLYVPDFAGSGQIGISPSSSSPPTYSASSLVVPFSETNIQYKQTQHVKDAPGQFQGYIWELNTAFATNTSAVSAFNRARQNWVCETEMNWFVGAATTAVNASSLDNINIVRFDGSLPSGVLGVCYSYYSSCGGDYYVAELDIAFNSNVNWNYSTGNPGVNEYDFETVALHELGHGRQLRHIIDGSKVMHFALAAGTKKRVISPDEIVGGIDITDRSSDFSIAICGKDPMLRLLCQPMGITENSLESVAVFPNPTHDILNINSNAPLVYSIYDLQGRTIIHEENINTGENKVNMLSFKTGIYFIKISNGNEFITRKIIKN